MPLHLTDVTGAMRSGFKLTQPTVSQAVRRGQKIAEDQRLCLIEKYNQYFNGRPQNVIHVVHERY